MSKQRDPNIVIVVGRLTGDPELKHTTAGKSVCHFRIANNQGESNGRELDPNFFNCEAWDKVADIIATNLEKGRKVHIEGKLSFEKYTDKAGQPRNTVKIIVRQITFLDYKNENSNG